MVLVVVVLVVVRRECSLIVERPKKCYLPSVCLYVAVYVLVYFLCNDLEGVMAYYNSYFHAVLIVPHPKVFLSSQTVPAIELSVLSR